MAEDIKLKTKRLVISPMTDDELERLIQNTEDVELAKAYGEMLDGCRKDCENRLWYTAWKLCLKENPNVMVGDVCFKGPQVNGAVEIGYGMKPEFEGMGYMTEAVKKVMEWAVSQKDVYIIYAETAPDNKASQRILEKLNFKPCEGEEAVGEEGPRFRYDKPGPFWMSIYLCLGFSCGMTIGMINEHMSLGMCIGMLIGVAIGVVLDDKEKKHRNEVTGEGWK